MAFNWFKKKKKSQESADAAIRISETEAETAKAAEEEWSLPTLEELEDVGTASLSEVLLEVPDAAATEEMEEPITAVESVPNAAAGKGFLARLRRGLAKTRHVLTADLEDLFQGRTGLDDEMLEQIEEMLITSDIGVRTTTDLMAAITRKASKISGVEDLKNILREEMLALLSTAEQPPIVPGKPHVIMVIGVNGVGKTTTIGKLAARMTQEGRSVLIAAADTFRAAAIEQLAVWAERSGADLIRHKDNADPAAVVFDSLEAAQARGRDVVMVDTAGRLHTKVNLMEELKKIRRTIGRKIADAPHEVLLVLDATTGQNAVSQAKLFHEAIGLTGLVLTKLDGTAKGGVVISICRELNLPLLYIGVGEGIEDLQPFDGQRFVDSLF